MVDQTGLIETGRGQRPVSAVIGSVTLLGIGSVVARAAEIDGPVLALHRAWVAALLYLLLLRVSGRRVGLEQLRNASPGGIAFGAQTALFYSAIQMTTVANTTMIMALHPVIVLAFFSARFNEPVRPIEWKFSLIAMAGIGLVVFGSSASPTWSPIGDLLAIASLIAWSLYFAASKRARATLGAVEYQGLLLVSSALFLLPIAFVLADSIALSSGKWPWVAAMVVVPGSGHLFINWAHPRIPLGLLSQLTLASPIVSVALAAAVLDGESVNATQLSGMTVVVAALGQLVKYSSQTQRGET